MNAPVKPPVAITLRDPFPPHQISKLPKPTKAQTDAVKADFKKGVRCKVCGSWHHPDVIHLDYVGHAALTDRLLDVDPAWFWEPAALRDGLPAFDQSGGLWIKLTVNGVSRLGYGHAAVKPGMDPGSREKEVIGDALRNAAMRFGAALDLWHKGDLHVSDDGDGEGDKPPEAEEAAKNLLRGASADQPLFKETWLKNQDGWKRLLPAESYARVVAVMKECAAKFPPTKTDQQREAEDAGEGFRPQGRSRVAGNGRDVSKPNDFGIGEDEIPY